MFKFLFTIVFLSELIIAITAIVWIYRFNKQVNIWNNIVVLNKKQIQSSIIDFRLFLKLFADNLFKITELIKYKRKYYLTSILKTTFVYYGIFTLKGKYKKAVLAYQLVKEVYEGICDA